MSQHMRLHQNPRYFACVFFSLAYCVDYDGAEGGSAIVDVRSHPGDSNDAVGV